MVETIDALGGGAEAMLAKLLRAFMWLWVIYAVLVNMSSIIGAFMTFQDPWPQIAEWYNPLTFENWRDELGLLSPAVAARLLSQWLCVRG